MVVNWLRNRSLFLKLILVLALVALLVNLAVAAFFSHFLAKPRKVFGQFIRGCTHYVMESLGDPPNRQQALAVGERMGLEFRYELPEGGFATADWVPFSREVEFHRHGPGRFGPPESLRHGHRPMRFGHMENRPVLQFDQGPGKLLAVPRFTLSDREPWPELLGLLGFLSLLLIGSWYTLRRLFRPLEALDGAVREVTAGNLKVQVPVKGQDELGNLSKAFNQMTEGIRQSLHSKEQLLYNVSHELRSPLTRMRLSVEFLPEGKQRQTLVEELSQMDAMIDELLESARLDSAHGLLEKAPVDLGQLLTGLAQQQPGRVELSLPEQAVVLTGDFKRLERLFRNLIENGLKYSPEGSPVEVSLQVSGGAVQIEVCDQGPGVPLEDRPHLFEPFYRVDKSRSVKTGGYGLGLALVKQIAEAHQGQVSLDESRTQGACFKVELPL